MWCSSTILQRLTDGTTAAAFVSSHRTIFHGTDCEFFQFFVVVTLKMFINFVRTCLQINHQLTSHKYKLHVITSWLPEIFKNTLNSMLNSPRFPSPLLTPVSLYKHHRLGCVLAGRNKIYLHSLCLAAWCLVVYIQMVLITHVLIFIRSCQFKWSPQVSITVTRKVKYL